VGSVYGFEDFNGAMASLDKLVSEGFWSVSGYPDRQRQAEGFNNVMIAAWPQEEK
jgi:CRISPR-associated protein Cmr3